MLFLSYANFSTICYLLLLIIHSYFCCYLTVYYFCLRLRSLYFLMLITAVCFLFLLKLRWPKNKSIYDIVSLWTTNSLMACGLNTKFLCQLLTRNVSVLFWLPMSGVLVGLAGVFCFTSITKRWFTFSIRRRFQTQTLCTCCVACQRSSVPYLYFCCSSYPRKRL